jgi:hypothetical protein
MAFDYADRYWEHSDKGIWLTPPGGHPHLSELHRWLSGRPS